MARLASLFGSLAENEKSQDSSELELRQRLDRRIEQALADAIIGVPVPEKDPEVAPAPEPGFWLDGICAPAGSRA